jgi:GlcNAc-PI de-N-acetylase
MFSPHPDDEVITGGLTLRLLRELKMRVINVTVSQGTNPSRQAERWQRRQLLSHLTLRDPPRRSRFSETLEPPCQAKDLGGPPSDSGKA